MHGAALVAAGTFLVVFLAASTIMWLTFSRRAAQAPRAATARRPSAAAVWTVFGAAVVVTLLTIIAFTKTAVWLLDPILTWLSRGFWTLFLHPAGAVALGLVVLLAGLPFARRFRSPARFTSGVVLVAIALVTFWPLQWGAGVFDFRFWEWEAALHGAAGFLSVCLLTAGTEMMWRANNTPRDDSWEFWR